MALPLYAYLVCSSADLTGTVIVATGVVAAANVYGTLKAGAPPGLSYVPIAVGLLGGGAAIGNTVTAQTAASVTMTIQ